MTIVIAIKNLHSNLPPTSTLHRVFLLTFCLIGSLSEILITPRLLHTFRIPLWINLHPPNG